MDGLRWSRVLLQWVKDSRLINCECESIEQCSVEEFYRQFRSRMQSVVSLPEDGIISFLKEHFPHYELYLTETGQIAAPDHFYIFSLLLFFSCVRHSERFFQQICNGFDKPQQYAVTAFLKSMWEAAHQRKEVDRMMIRQAIQDAMPQTMLPPETTPPQRAEQLSMPSRLTSSSDVLDSPLRLNRQPPKISPPTPRTIILDEKTKQLKELKAQLEAENYDKGYLEVQLKQLQDKNDKLLEEKRQHVKEIRELRTELQASNRENESPNKQRSTDHKVARIERQLAEKEEALDRFKIELETVGENYKNATEMVNYRNVQIVKLKDQIQELENSLGSLSECIAEKDEVIKCLRENNEELQRFIEESRFKQNDPLPENLNTSFDGLELSSGGSSVGASGKSYSISPENMAQAVVDVQLKEKEAENCMLKRSLDMIEQEKVRVSGLVGSFFRLYDDMVGALPFGSANPQDVGFVEKMNIFKACYQTLFEELGKFKEGKELLEVKSEALEEDVRALKTELVAKMEVLGKLESHSADIERQLELVQKTASEYQRKNVALDEDLNRQKRDLLKLISEKDSLSQQNLHLNVEFNSLKGDHESLTQKIDYLMLSLNEDYEGSDFSSWFDKMDDLKERLRTLKDDKERLTTMNMKITMEKVGLEKDLSNSDVKLREMEERQDESEQKIRQLSEQLRRSETALTERDDRVASLERMKADLEENIQGLSAELLELQDSLNNKSEDFQSCEETLHAVREELDSQAKELAVEKETNATLQSNLEVQLTALQDMEQLQQKTVNEKNQLAIKLEELQQNLSNESSNLLETIKNLDQVKIEKQQLIEERNQIQQQKLALEESLSAQRSESSKNCEIVQSLEAQVQNMEQLLANQSEQSKEMERSLNGRIDEKQKLLAAAKNEQDVLTAVNRSLLSGFELIQTNIERLEDQYLDKIVNLQGKLGEFSALVTKLSAYQFKLRLEKTQLEENLGKMNAEFKALQIENDKLMEVEKTLHQTVQKLHTEKGAMEERSFGLEEQLAEMEFRLDLDGGRIKELESSYEELIVEKTKLLEDGNKREAEQRKQVEDAVVHSEKLLVEIKEMDESRAGLQQQFDEKIKHLKDVSRERDEMEVKCSRLEVDLKEMQTDLEEQKQLTARRCQENDALEDQLQAIRLELAQVVEEKTRLEANLAEEQVALAERNDTISRLCREKELLEEKVQELATLLITVRQTKAALQRSLEEEQEKSDELSSQIEDLNTKLSTAAEELGQLAMEKEELLNTQSAIEAEKQEFVERVQELTESIAFVEEDRDTLREEKCRLEAEVERIDHDKGSLDEQCGKLLKQLSMEREEAAAQKAKHEKTTTALSKERAELEVKLKVMDEKRNVLDGKVQELEESKKVLEVALGDKGAVESKVGELSKLVDELRVERANLEAEKTCLCKEQESNKKAIDELKKELTSMEEIKATKESEVLMLQETNQELQMTVEETVKALDASKQVIKSLEGESKKLEEGLAQKEAEVVKLATEVEETNKNRREVEESLKAKEQESAEVEKQLVEKVKEIEVTQQQKQEEILLQTENIQYIQTEQQETSKRLEQALKEKSNLESMVLQLTDELDNRSKELTHAAKEIHLKEQEIFTASESLNASEAKSSELKMSIAELNSEKTSLESKLRNLEDELETQKKLTLSKEQTAEELTAKLAETSESKKRLELQLNQLESDRSAVESTNQLLVQQLSNVKAQVTDQLDFIDAKDSEIHQLTAGLEKVKSIQSQLEKKVSGFESIVAEKDEIESQLVRLQNELELVRDDKRKIESELEKVKEENNDVDRRLIQQLQDYDTLNEAFLNERDSNRELTEKHLELDRTVQDLRQENSRLVQAQESCKSLLAAKEKRLVEQEKQMEKLKREMDGLFGKNQQMDSLSHEFMQLKVEKSELEAKKEELNEAIEQNEIQQKAMQESMDHLRESLKVKQQELDVMHSDMTTLKETLHTLKIENSRLKSTQELQQDKMLNLELKNTEQSKKIEKLEESLSKTEISHMEDNSKASTLLKQLDKYKEYEVKMKQLEELHQKERDINEKGIRDNDILRAKLIKHRKVSEEQEQKWKQDMQLLTRKLEDVTKLADEKLKEVRIEYEGKLEKMKEKMKSLYNDEILKINKRHEKDYSELKVEIDHEKKKFCKMEVHAGKLQQQIGNLNEKNLDLMKENEFMKSKLRIMEEIRGERKSMLPPPAHARLCANLKMEDEEGEIFNNTYLTDLKAGRMSPPFAGRDSIRYSELQQRNSMLPPHLKSSYLPQYVDGELTDDDNRDLAAGNLDDSSTSLISRKKLSGTTSYKRPGPPTPSKKAGRLSFGGSLPTNDFQYKEILKDNSQSNGGMTTTSTMSSFGSRLSFGGRKSNVDSSMAAGAAAGSSGSIADLNARRKTPGKFKQMISSTNLFNTLQAEKDENTPPRRRLGLFNKHRK
ncbi:uncharacterized protein mud isoform X2 [Ochlerotatus camptorhynchus]|uniref:uncharacterized protein mud isoform X2 n=1 Tax=Ochlerotatus camptorhynchus TaxID=644619 RepID=UPI0031DE9F2E